MDVLILVTGKSYPIWMVRSTWVLSFLFFARVAPQWMEVLDYFLRYPFEVLAGCYRMRKALVLAV